MIVALSLQDAQAFIGMAQDAHIVRIALKSAVLRLLSLHGTIGGKTGKKNKK
jgi:hypothetical protein